MDAGSPCAPWLSARGGGCAWQETRDFLFQIVRIVNLKHTDLNIMDTVSDTSYAWHVSEDYVEIIHNRVCYALPPGLTCPPCPDVSLVGDGCRR
jgi:hypothetical protein